MWRGPTLPAVAAVLGLVLTVLPTTARAEITIDASQAIWILDPEDVGYAAPPPLKLALDDVQRDWYKVFGYRPSVVSSSSAGRGAVPKGFKGTAVFFGQAAARVANSSSSHYEAHAVAVQSSEDVNLIICTGNSIRGMVFAAYAFSERVLGVEPLWWWMDTEVAFAGQIHFGASSDIAVDYGAPEFQWRAFFTNDEDLLGNFMSDPLGQSVFSATAWNRVCEALLRLKGNLLLPGTVAFPDESSYTVARRRGIAVSMQHFTLLGVNTWRWPAGLPYSFNQNPEIQEFVWQASVEAYEGRETVWTVGYRGLNDYPFWIDEPAFNTTKKRCALISAAMKRQVEIVRATPGREHDPCITFLWSEMLDLYLSGELELPANTSVVFADAGGSGSFDPRIEALLGPGSGAYYHVQMESPGTMSQLTEMVPPQVFFRELRNFTSKKAVEIFILNLSDLKPAAFMVDTVFRYLWDPKAADSMDPSMAQERAIESWSRRFFGDAYAPDASDVMQGYFNVDYILGEVTGRRYGDEHLSGLIRKLLAGQEHAADAQKFVAHPLEQLQSLYGKAGQLYEKMVAKAAPGASAFQSFKLFIATHLFGCRAVNATAFGNYSGAINELESLLAEQRAAERLKWRGWYGADRLVGFANLICLLRERASSEPPQVCNLPDGRAYRAGTGAWSDWFIYGNTSKNFPFLNPPPVAKSMDHFVRILCADSSCTNTPVGGHFTASSTLISLVTDASAELVEIRFTLDGTDPTASSPLYQHPFSIHATTMVSARAFSKDSEYPTATTRALFDLRGSAGP